MTPGRPVASRRVHALGLGQAICLQFQLTKEPCFVTSMCQVENRPVTLAVHGGTMNLIDNWEVIWAVYFGAILAGSIANFMS